jgi:hypothetical protein
LKSSSVKLISTLAHSGRAAGPSLMMVFTDPKFLFLFFLVSNSMAHPHEIGMIVPKDGKAFEFCGLELDSGLDELSGGGGKISRIGCGCWIDWIACN